MFDFTGKRAIITGASRGIGRAIALAFARAGAAVSICALDAAALEETRQELARHANAHAGICDLSSADAITHYIADAAAAVGGIDILINIGSTTAIRPSIRAPAYGAIKAAIKYHTATQAVLLAKRNIRVNFIAPGSVTAPGHFWKARKAADDPAYHEAIATIPAGRLGEADEIADTVLFMASPAARWVYDQTLIVDGGQTLFGG